MTWDEYLALDVWYVDHWSLRLDLSIVMRTVRELVFDRGISATATLSRTTDNELEFRGRLDSGRMPHTSEERSWN
jgi:hypothetical protein